MKKNYIQKLQEENEILKKTIKNMENGLIEIKSYLCLPKFTDNFPANNFVNPDDIHLRINEILEKKNDQLISIDV